jgi:thiopeptide-type bacteriocin biosynthesis protein
MSADHVTTLSSHHLATGVLAVLAGTDLNTAAAHVDLTPAELEEAVRLYQAAGLTALERQAERAWYDLRVEFPNWSAAEAIGAQQIGLALDHLQADGAVARWWFLRKHPSWRLRLHRADVAAVNALLDELVTAGTIARWWSTVYESETAAFGGSTGMNTIHELFCADSRGVLDYLRHPQPALGRRELSILLLSGLLRAAGLDTFECGDVFARVTQLRPMPADADTHRVKQLAHDLRALLSIPDLPTSDLFTSGGPVEHAAPWLAAFHRAGRELGDAAARGHLGRGVRAILTHVVIFRWNRFGLSATSQGILAHAASTALLPHTAAEVVSATIRQRARSRSEDGVDQTGR